MAKSIRCKVKKRFRTAKRQLVDATIGKKRLQESNRKCNMIGEGRIGELKIKKKKNAFLYPDDPDAEIPKHELVKPLDFRSTALPGAWYAAKGGRRKKFSVEERAGMAVVGVEGTGAFRGKMIRDVEDGDNAMVDGDAANITFFQDTGGETVENNPVNEMAKELKAQGSNIIRAPVVPGTANKSKGKAAISASSRVTKGPQKKKKK